jgi:tetratricopeptide (TPR) repeat protein
MGILRGPGSRSILLAASLVFSAAAHAVCTGPPAMTAQLHAHPTAENAVQLGSWFASHKQFDCAVVTFRDAIKTNPQSAQLYYLEGLALVGEGKTTEAIPAMQASIRAQADVIKPHLLLAYLYDKQDHPDEAAEQWKLALKIDPKNEQALEGLSGQLLAQHDFVSVVGLLSNAPRTEKLAINLSQAFGMLGHLDEANAVLTEALKSSPDSVPLASAMTVVLVNQLHYQEAVNAMQHAVEKNPGSMEAKVQLFRVLVLTNRINQARPMGPKLLAERPHDSEVLYLNGIVERITGDTAASKAHLEEAVALDPTFFNSHYNLGKVLVIRGEWQEAKEQLEKALELGAIEPEVHYELAMALRGLGDREGSIAESKKYQDLRKIEEDGLQASMAASNGDKELAAGNVPEAISNYREASDDVPDNALYKYKLAIALHRSGDLAGERAQLEAAVKLNPALAGAQKQLGYLLARSGDSAGSIEHFQMAVKAAPGWVEAWVNLAAEMAEAGQFADARKAVAMALRIDPGNADAKELSDQLARDPSAQQPNP